MKNNSPQNQTFSFNILIVDDEHAILDILSTGLKNWGHNCFTALNAQDSLFIAEKEKIHFSLIDIRLPDRSGLDLCGDIRRVSPGTINVLMTGYPGIKSAVEGMKFGAFDYLVKPFRIEQVLAIIDRAKKDIRLMGENQYNKETIRNLKNENEQLRQFIHEMMPDETRQRIQSLNKYRMLKIDKEKAAQSYSKHKSLPQLTQKK